MEPDVKHTTIVISPLVALMRDHVAWLKDHGILANMITASMSADDTEGTYIMQTYNRKHEEKVFFFLSFFFLSSTVSFVPFL